MRGVRVAAMVCGLLTAGPVRPAAAPAIQRDTPRPYGYAIGDLIHHELIIQPGRNRTLDRRSIPTIGPLNRWAELRNVRVEDAPGGRIRLLLDYQVFYAPLTVKNLALPGFTLRFDGPEGATSQDIPAWPFTMTPIHGLAVLDSAETDPVRPDAWPAPPDTSTPLRRMACAAFVAAGALLYLAHLRGLLGVDARGRPFRDAHRTLCRLRRQGAKVDLRRQAFSTVHRAFDRSLGEPLFAEHLPEFFDRHPHYEGLRKEIESFFAASYGLFFGSTDDTEKAGVSASPSAAGESFRPERLEALCLACLQAERRHR